MKPQDASAMLSELDKQKIPYRLEADGTAILIAPGGGPQDPYPPAGAGPPAAWGGGVRALQQCRFRHDGVRPAHQLSARAARRNHTHDPVAGQCGIGAGVDRDAGAGLFHRGAGVPTASIAVALRDGRSLSPEQVLGIQRLVSASIPDIESRNVTIVNQNGVALTAGRAKRTAPRPSIASGAEAIHGGIPVPQGDRHAGPDLWQRCGGGDGGRAVEHGPHPDNHRRRTALFSSR